MGCSWVDMSQMDGFSGGGRSPHQSDPKDLLAEGGEGLSFARLSVL